MITHPFDLVLGSSPILVSMPHAGTALTPAVAEGLTEVAQTLPDTDWHIPQLYSFLPQLGVGYIKARYSRLVVDLNRPADDRPLYSTATTGLFPQRLFDGSPVYRVNRAPSARERDRYRQQIWQPYHHAITAELERLHRQHGYAILFDAHSIAARAPLLFEGTLTDFNFGNNNGQSCDRQLLSGLEQRVRDYGLYSQVSNARFKGGYITRHYGQPSKAVTAVQLELSQATYLRPGANYQIHQGRLSQLQPLLKQLLQHLLEQPACQTAGGHESASESNSTARSTDRDELQKSGDGEW